MAQIQRTVKHLDFYLPPTGWEVHSSTLLPATTGRRIDDQLPNSRPNRRIYRTGNLRMITTYTDDSTFEHLIPWHLNRPNAPNGRSSIDIYFQGRYNQVNYAFLIDISIDRLGNHYFVQPGDLFPHQDPKAQIHIQRAPGSDPIFYQSGIGEEFKDSHYHDADSLYLYEGWPNTTINTAFAPRLLAHLQRQGHTSSYEYVIVRFDYAAGTGPPFTIPEPQPSGLHPWIAEQDRPRRPDLRVRYEPIPATLPLALNAGTGWINWIPGIDRIYQLADPGKDTAFILSALNRAKDGALTYYGFITEIMGKDIEFATWLSGVTLEHVGHYFQAWDSQGDWDFDDFLLRLGQFYQSGPGRQTVKRAYQILAITYASRGAVLKFLVPGTTAALLFPQLLRKGWKTIFNREAEDVTQEELDDFQQQPADPDLDQKIDHFISQADPLDLTFGAGSRAWLDWNRPIPPDRPQEGA